MIVWVLLFKATVAAPIAPQVVPYLAFESQAECVTVYQSLPADTKADCVAFAADVVDD
jgi:hypothetical protein